VVLLCKVEAEDQMDKRMMCGQGRRIKTGWHEYGRQPEAPRLRHGRVARSRYLTVLRCLPFLRLQVFLDHNGGSLAVEVERRIIEMTAVFMPPHSWQQHARCLNPDFVTIAKVNSFRCEESKAMLPLPP